MAAAVDDVPKAERAAKVPEMVIDLEANGIAGDIRWNARGFMRAHCHFHGGQCRRQRQTTPGRSGAGRPIGSLVHWLRSAENYKDQISHVVALPGTFLQRSCARELFESVPGCQTFLDLERPQLSSEESSEPSKIP